MVSVGVLGVTAAACPPLVRVIWCVSSGARHLVRVIWCASWVPDSRGDRRAGAGEALRLDDRRRRPLLQRPPRRGHRLPRTERLGQVHDDADDDRARPPEQGLRHDRRPRLRRAQVAAAPRRCAARGQGHPPRAQRAQPPSCARPSNRIPNSRVDEVIEQVGLGPVATKRAGGFSLGMGQRLGMAAALLGDPEVLLFDEPVNGLDPEGIQWVRELLKALAKQGRTVFVSSHLMSEMALTADHVIVIGRGRLLEDADIATMVARAGSSVLVRSPDAEKLAAALRTGGATVTAGEGGSIVVTGPDAEAIGELAATPRHRRCTSSPHSAPRSRRRSWRSPRSTSSSRACCEPHSRGLERVAEVPDSAFDDVHDPRDGGAVHRHRCALLLCAASAVGR